MNDIAAMGYVFAATFAARRVYLRLPTCCIALVGNRGPQPELRRAITRAGGASLVRSSVSDVIKCLRMPDLQCCGLGPKLPTRCADRSYQKRRRIFAKKATNVVP
jgi:hypothetical protein